MSLNFATILRENVRSHPNRVAVIEDDRRMTFAELLQQARRFGNVLSGLGLEPGDKVAIMSENRLEYPAAYFGMLMAGCVMVAVNILLTEREVAHCLQDSDSKVFIAGESVLPAAEPAFRKSSSCKHLLVLGDESKDTIQGYMSFHGALRKASDQADLFPTGADDPAAIIYTSGTTGVPKGATLSHCNMFLTTYCLQRDFVGQPAPDHVGLTVVPPYVVGGVVGCMGVYLHAGAAITLVRRFDPELVLHVMKRDKVTLLTGVPTMYIRILECSDKSTEALKGLRAAFSGASAMPVEVLETYRDRFGFTNICEGWGCTESSGIATLQLPNQPHKLGSVGKPLWGVQVGVLNPSGESLSTGEDGELVIRGYNVMLGYYNRPQASAETIRNGWLHTGDIGHYDEDGDFYIVDRLKDMIIRGGYNVYPREVEEILYTMPGVREASVIGIPDPVRGEEVCACLSVDGNAGIAEAAVIAYCKKQLGAYKYPRIVLFFDSLPKNPTGKILKRQLREIVAKLNRNA
jgi:long-chain acyl-CoA synthetase